MNLRNCLFTIALCLSVAASAATAHAQQPPYASDAEIEALERQIRETGRQIRDLETQYGHSLVPNSAPRGLQPDDTALPWGSHGSTVPQGHQGVVGVGHSEPAVDSTFHQPTGFIATTSPEFERLSRPAVAIPGTNAAATQAGPNTPAPRDGISVGHLAAEFEKRWQEQQDVDFDRFVKSGTDLSTMRIVGRVHADHWAFPDASRGVSALETDNSNLPPQDRLLFRRLRFGVRGDVWENMEYRIEMEFAGGDDSQFRDAWLGFKHLPLLQTVRIGNQKRPYGLDHLNSSRYNVFIERPFIVEAFNQDSRRIGIQSWGYSEDLAYNWRFGVFNMRLIQDEGDYISDNYQSELAGRLAHTYWYDECSDGRGYAHFAIAGSVGSPDGNTPVDNGQIGPDMNEAQYRTRPEARTSSRWLDTGKIAGADWFQLVGLESVFNVGPVQLVSEYMNVWMQRESGFGPDLFFHGGYAYISYFLTGEYMPWKRKTGELGRVEPYENFFLVDKCSGDCGRGWGAWQVAFRWSYADLTDDNILGGVGQSFTFGLNWYWNANASMQFNYIHGDISERNVTDVNGLTFSGGTYNVFGTRFRIDF